DVGIAGMDDPPNALQPNTSLDIDSGDSAIQSAVWKNNVLWATGSDTCKDASDTDDRACVRFLQVSTSGGLSVLQDQDLTLVGGYLISPRWSSTAPTTCGRASRPSRRPPAPGCPASRPPRSRSCRAGSCRRWSPASTTRPARGSTTAPSAS